MCSPGCVPAVGPARVPCIVGDSDSAGSGRRSRDSDDCNKQLGDARSCSPRFAAFIRQDAKDQNIQSVSTGDHSSVHTLRLQLVPQTLTLSKSPHGTSARYGRRAARGMGGLIILVCPLAQSLGTRQPSFSALRGSGANETHQAINGAPSCIKRHLRAQLHSCR